jgi:hypothetical protein
LQQQTARIHMEEGFGFYLVACGLLLVASSGGQLTRAV